MSRQLKLSATVLTCIVALSWAATQLKLETNQHLSDSDCVVCHLSGRETTIDNAKLLTDSQENLCLDCHPSALEASHPSGFPPVSKLPEEFPVDWKGDMTCSTCHRIHHNEPGLMRTEARGRELCFSCHNEQFFEQMADHGQSLLISGHIAEVSSYGEIGLDSYSIHCMSCHAELGDSLQVNISLDGVMRHSGGTINHPVGTQYDLAAGYGSFRSSALLPKEIKLPDGKVSCVSCHQAYTEKHGALVMSNSGSKLCLRCHDL